MSWPGYVEMEGTWWPPKTAGRVPGSPGQYCQHSANGEGAEDTRMWWNNSTDLICGFSSKKLTEYKLIATNSSDRLRHVPNYFSIFFNKSACCLQKKKNNICRWLLHSTDNYFHGFLFVFVHLVSEDKYERHSREICQNSCWGICQKISAAGYGLPFYVNSCLLYFPALN